MPSSAERLSMGIYQRGSCECDTAVSDCDMLWLWHSQSVSKSSMLTSSETSRHVAKMYAMCSSSGEMRRSNACCLWRSTLGSAFEHTRTVSSKGFGSLNFPATKLLIAEWIRGMLPGHQYGETHPILPPAVYTPPSDCGISFQSVTAMWPPCFGWTGAWLRMSENKSVLGRQIVKDGQIKTRWRRSINWNNCQFSYVKMSISNVKSSQCQVKSIGLSSPCQWQSMSISNLKDNCSETLWHWQIYETSNWSYMQPRSAIMPSQASIDLDHHVHVQGLGSGSPGSHLQENWNKWQWHENHVMMVKWLSQTVEHDNDSQWLHACPKLWSSIAGRHPRPLGLRFGRHGRAARGGRWIMWDCGRVRLWKCGCGSRVTVEVWLWKWQCDSILDYYDLMTLMPSMQWQWQWCRWQGLWPDLTWQRRTPCAMTTSSESLTWNWTLNILTKGNRMKLNSH